ADPAHGGVGRFLADLGAFYEGEPALWAADYDVSGFHWIDCHDAEQSVISYMRRAPGDPGRDVGGIERVVVCVFNFTPVPRHGYPTGFPAVGRWRERLNSDAELYGGSNLGNAGAILAEPVGHHGQPASVALTLPPLGALVLVRG